MQRIAVGTAAPADHARAVSGTATVRTALALRKEECSRDVNALTALTGRSPSSIRELIEQPKSDDIASAMPVAPYTKIAIPATVIARHPSVMAAEREVAAAWAEIGIARAERLPRVDVSGLLTGQWLSVAGASSGLAAWSIGAVVSMALLDGGKGAAAVDAADARYRRSAAQLRSAVRAVAQDVENALAATVSARERMATTHDSVNAAARVLAAVDAQWRAGAVSLFELEDARRQYAAARNDAIVATRDSGHAWISLVRASGNAAIASESAG